MRCLPSLKHFVIGLVAIVIVAAGPNDRTRAVTEQANKPQGTFSSLLLDFAPLEQALSTLVVIDASGSVRVVRYTRNLLSIESVQEGALRQEDLDDISRRLRDHSSSGSAQGTGKVVLPRTEGDVYYLSIDHRTDHRFVVSGVAEEAPAEFRRFIQDLLSLDVELIEVEVAPSFLRSQAISTRRYELLQRSGRVAFLQLEAFSEDMQSVIRRAFSRPLEFVPITTWQREEVSSHAGLGQELFVEDRGFGYQLTPFSAAR